MIAKSIERVVEMGLCVGCGVCAAICPYQAIKIVKDYKDGVYKPVVSENCRECGLCIKACFGIGVNPELSVRIFGQHFEDSVLGTCLNCHVGYACDNKVRYSSASGGIVTALLIFALEEKMIDGVLVTKMDEKRPLEPKPFIAKTKSEVISAAGSKYCPVPADVALRSILQEDGQYAVVGLPCHIYGARKAASIYPDLAKRILFYIGIFCSGPPNFQATEYLLRRLKVKVEEVARIDYRGEGWPGKMLIQLKGMNNNGRNTLLLPYPKYWNGFGSFFRSYGCALCADGFNKFADISCGDAWLPEYRDDDLGTSLIIVRNEIGKQLISAACEKGRIQIENIQCARVKEAQKSMVRLKTRNLRVRFQLLKTLGKPLPIYDNMNVEMSSSAFTNYIHCTLSCIFRFIASKRSMWNLLDLYSVLQRRRGLKQALKRLRSKLQIP